MRNQTNNRKKKNETKEKKKVKELQTRQVHLMNQMKVLFNGNFGK